MQVPEPWESPSGGLLAVGGAGGTATPCIHGQWKLDNFISQGRPLLKFHLSCTGPKGGGGLGYQRTAWNNTQPQGMGPHAGLGWGIAVEDAPFLVICGGYGTSFVKNCISAWNQTSSRWFGPGHHCFLQNFPPSSSRGHQRNSVPSRGARLKGSQEAMIPGKG